MSRERLIEQLLDVLEDEAATQAAATPPVPATAARFLVGDPQAARTIGELKEILRTTADLLEMEAAHLRQELERLERTGSPTVCH